MMLDLVRPKQSTIEAARSYQNVLRAIGRYADDQGLCHIGLYEVENGFILRGFDAKDFTAVQALEIPDSELEALVVKNFTSRSKARSGGHHSTLCPTGYEDYLRAVGYELDQRSASKVSLTELTEEFGIAYMELNTTTQGYVWSPRSFVESASAVQDRLDQAFGRRAGR